MNEPKDTQREQRLEQLYERFGEMKEHFVKLISRMDEAQHKPYPYKREHSFLQQRNYLGNELVRTMAKLQLSKPEDQYNHLRYLSVLANDYVVFANALAEDTPSGPRRIQISPHISAIGTLLRGIAQDLHEVGLENGELFAGAQALLQRFPPPGRNKER